MRKTYFLILIALGFHVANAQTIIRRVTPTGSATGADGSNWTDKAYKNIQDAINASASGDIVWVAKGTYKPTEKLQDYVYKSTTEVGDPTTDRDKAFIMKGGVKVYGGFAGNESEDYDISNRNFVTNETILSGDLNGDDVPDNDPNYITKKADNTYHVVSARNNSNGALLDGFTIQSGYANGTASVSGDGTTGKSSVTIAQNIGGGIATRGGGNGIVYSNLIVKDNYASDDGGGAYINTAQTSVISLANVQFLNNTSNATGGGLNIYVASQTPTVNITNSIFQGNSCSAEGGAFRVYVNGGTPAINIKESKFISNSAGGRGGVCYLYGSGASAKALTTIVNSLFYDNSSATTSNTLGGGALALGTGAKTTVINSTFYGNKTTKATSVGGGAIHISSSSSCNLYLYNSIFNGNTAAGGVAPDIFKGSAAPTPVIYNTLTQGYGTDGTNGVIVNASATPFESTTSTDANFLKLVAVSVALDKGTNSILSDGLKISSTDGSIVTGTGDENTIVLLAGNSTTKDLAGNSRIRNTTVDLGAYELQVGDDPLPVTLDYFKATKQGNLALLTWKTLAENNNQKFVLERGTSADKFIVLKTISSTGAGIYNYTDNNPLAGTNYYRLIQYDNNGTAAILGIEALTFDLSGKALVYPNPANKYVWVKPSSSNSIVSLNLISLTGKIISAKSYASITVNEAVKLDLTSVPTGTYILWINKGKANAEKQTLLVVQ